jgi:hypothetical protein
MNIRVPVKDKAEAHAIEHALDDPTTRAFVIIMGTLQQLPDDRARARVLAWAFDWADDPAHAATPAVTATTPAVKGD